jgi:UDP-N-acetylglucosamine--N-acetylmuramyl-(pentapeptide) pyrophosphoryl-undecaprenol N-acetylglucosamine transferase
MMLLEHEMTAPTLQEALSGLLKNREKLSAMAASARTFAHPQAAARIAKMVAGLASSSSR